MILHVFKHMLAPQNGRQGIIVGCGAENLVAGSVEHQPSLLLYFASPFQPTSKRGRPPCGNCGCGVCYGTYRQGASAGSGRIFSKSNDKTRNRGCGVFVLHIFKVYPPGN